jgi:hypothetical protein
MIKKDYGDYRYLIYNNYTGEETPVVIDPDKRDLFQDKTIFEKLPQTCPFFRHQPDSENSFCTVYQTRPEICRNYGCWRLLILNHRGRRVGRIKHIRTLCSEDPLLIRIWDYCIENHQESDDRVWDDQMIRTLTYAGYTVRQ